MFFVTTTYSHTDRRFLTQVLSEGFNTPGEARAWRDANKSRCEIVRKNGRVYSTIEDVEILATLPNRIDYMPPWDRKNPKNEEPRFYVMRDYPHPSRKLWKAYTRPIHDYMSAEVSRDVQLSVMKDRKQGGRYHFFIVAKIEEHQTKLPDWITARPPSLADLVDEAKG